MGLAIGLKYPNIVRTTHFKAMIQLITKKGCGPLNLIILGKIKGMIAVYKEMYPTQVSSTTQ